MNEEELQLTAQFSLQEFDDARADPNSDLHALGQKAIAALDACIAYWNDKPFMQQTDGEMSEGGDDDMKQYAERQIEAAEYERERVRKLLTSPGGDGAGDK
jgi:hypothetical protein